MQVYLDPTLVGFLVFCLMLYCIGRSVVEMAENGKIQQFLVKVQGLGVGVEWFIKGKIPPRK